MLMFERYIDNTIFVVVAV